MEIDDNMNLRVASFSCYLDTDKDNLVRRISSAQENPSLLTSAKTMSPTKKPLFINNFSSPYSKDHNKGNNTLTNLRVDSYSYNFKNSGENLVLNVPGPVQDPTFAFTFPKTTPKDGEISIFGADKYFNMKLEYPTKELKHEERPVNLARVGSGRIKPIKTPSLFSEASSFNSQTALLQKVGSQKRHKKPFGSRIFGCHARCFDKKGVHINFCSPNPNRGPEIITVKKPMEVVDLDESRKSIEVFGCSTTNSKANNIVATNMERKLSILTWDAIPKVQNLPTSKSNTICDDMASDASSDLFEIENISGSIYPISAENDDDDMSSHYAPSEASIQWSVVTASAVDYNDETSLSVAAGDMISTNNKSPKKGISRPGGLLGCKSHKAVDVAENTSRKTNDQNPKQHSSMSFGRY